VTNKGEHCYVYFVPTCVRRAFQRANLRVMMWYARNLLVMHSGKPFQWPAREAH